MVDICLIQGVDYPMAHALDCPEVAAARAARQPMSTLLGCPDDAVLSLTCPRHSCLDPKDLHDDEDEEG